MTVVGQVVIGVANEDKHEARNPKQIQNSNVSSAAPWVVRPRRDKRKRTQFVGKVSSTKSSDVSGARGIGGKEAGTEIGFTDSNRR